MKRGQVTLFIIFGVLVLGLVALFFFLRTTVIEERVQEARPVAEDVPTEFNPIKVFTEDCLQVTVEEGLMRLGQQGGYIDPELRFSEVTPTDSDGIMFGSDARIPYWYHNAQPNNENAMLLVKRVPATADMEDELEQWIEQELAACLLGYDVFLNEFSIEEGETRATVNILPGIVRVAVEHPLKVQWRDSEREMTHFYVEQESDIVRLHGIASEIVELQQQYSFLEGNTLSLIALFSDIDDTKLMPMTAATFNLANTEVWSESTLKENVKELLMYYVPLIRVLGARNFFAYRYPSGPYRDVKQRIYDDMILQLDGNTEGVEVRFNYLDFWEPYFDMNCEGDVCLAQSTVTPITIPPLGYFGMQRYKGVYDISYPVLVSLRVPATEGEEEYVFNFAIEANIRNNRAAFDGVLPDTLSTFKTSLLCNENQRASGDITVTVRDALSGGELSGAAVNYVLGDDGCSIGLTDEHGAVVDQLPSAVGGVAHGLYAGYLGAARPLDPVLGEEDAVDIGLWPYKVIELGVMKKRFVKCSPTCVADGVGTLDASSDGVDGPDGWSFLDVAMPLRDTEEAIVSFERVSEFDDPVSFSARVKGTETAQVRLPAGKYKLLITLLLDEEVVIPPNEICEDVSTSPLPFTEEEECFTIPEIRLQPFPNGGLQWDEEVLLELNPDDYYSSQKLTVYALSSGIVETPVNAREIKDLSLMGGVIEYSDAYKDNLQPTYE